MRRISPRIVLNTTEKDLDLIEIRAAQLLDEVGLNLQLPVALQRLAAHPHVRVKGDRVYFDCDYTLETLKSCQRHWTRASDTHIRVTVGGGALNILDDQTSELRPPTTDDLLRAFRVGDRLGLGGDPPVIPADIPAPVREVALYRLAWEHTKGFAGRDITSIPTGEYVFEMAQVAGKSPSLPLYMISPLQVNAENLALILHFADRLPRLSVGTMPMPCATAPLSAPGYLIQTLAEMIGGYMVLSLLLPGKTVAFGAKILAFDPFANVIGCGSPESLLQGQVEVALLARYAIVPSHFFWSMAEGCDAQAAAERMAGVMLGALAGVRSFGVAGRLQGEAFSLEQLLVDVEIASYIERVLEGQAWDDTDVEWLSEIRDAVDDGTFLGSPSTVAHYRAEISRGHLFTRHTLAQREVLAEHPLRARIREHLGLLDVPPPDYLSAEARDEMARIYRQAETHLLH